MAARNKQDIITKTTITNRIYKKKSCLGLVSKNNIGGLNMFNSTNHTLNFNVDQGHIYVCIEVNNPGYFEN